MLKALIGRKIGMTQIFTSEGNVIPVTVVQAGPCQVVQKKTTEKDGYNALQLGFEKIFKKNGLSISLCGNGTYLSNASTKSNIA